MTLKMQVTKTNSYSIQLTVSGILNSETSVDFDRQIQKSLADGAGIIVLDMADLEMITSAGVGVIMKTRISLAKRGGELVLLNMPPQIKKVFEIVRLLPTLAIFENTREMDEYLISIQRRIQEEGSFSAD